MQQANIFSGLFLWFSDMCVPLETTCQMQFSKAIMVMNMKCEFLSLPRKYRYLYFIYISISMHFKCVRSIEVLKKKENKSPKRLREIRKTQ